MSIKISGLDKLQNRLDNLKKASENLEKTTSVSSGFPVHYAFFG